MTRLPRRSKVFTSERSTFLAFIRRNQIAFWKTIYFVIAPFLFIAAAQKRFSWPQVPWVNYDPGYLQPALMKLNEGAFAHVQGLNFLYPGMIYLILRTWADFRAISVIQHFLGLIAGVLFLATWSRLADFFPKPRLNRILHEGIGLWGAGVGGNLSDEYQDRLARKMQQLTGGDRSRPIVAMGSNSERYQGRNLALRLVAMGYSQVYWYRGGREAWQAAGLPDAELVLQDW